jgi:pimeloyl-ACP methyl ester carboxylesterase
MSRRKKSALLAAGVVLVALYCLGPRVAADTTITFDPAAIGNDPDAYLARAEASVPGIREGLEKEIIWADPGSKAKTPLSIVYVHGFSASKGEVRPLPDKIAAALEANLFYTRLTGHGQDGAAMASGSVNSWVNDYAEALAIGRLIGDRVVVVATSTGAALATWAAAQPQLSRDVAAMVLISPNYGVQSAGAWLLTMPWGEQVAELIIGKERAARAKNKLRRQLWTMRYPSSALLPVAATMELAAAAPVETIKVPTLFIFSDADKVVRPDLTRSIAARWGAPHELLTVEESDDPSNHVIAGDAASPSTTQSLADGVIAWLTFLEGGYTPPKLHTAGKP